MKRAITVRLDDADYAALQKQADQLRMRPGALARILVHAGLTGDDPRRSSAAARAALELLVQRPPVGRNGRRCRLGRRSSCSPFSVPVSVVIDASEVVALLVPDERQRAAKAAVEGWLLAGEELHSPAVLPYEVASVLARLVFDAMLELDEVTQVWRDLADLGLVLHPFDLTRDGPEVATITAHPRRRHATDSSYVCLAKRLGTWVWTLDTALARNAVEVGLPVELVA